MKCFTQCTLLWILSGYRSERVHIEEINGSTKLDMNRVIVGMDEFVDNLSVYIFWMFIVEK